MITRSNARARAPHAECAARARARARLIGIKTRRRARNISHSRRTPKNSRHASLSLAHAKGGLSDVKRAWQLAPHAECAARARARARLIGIKTRRRARNISHSRRTPKNSRHASLSLAHAKGGLSDVKRAWQLDEARNDARDRARQRTRARARTRAFARSSYHGVCARVSTPIKSENKRARVLTLVQNCAARSYASENVQSKRCC